MTDYVKEILADAMAVSNKTPDEILDELVYCGICYICNNEYNDIPDWMLDIRNKLDGAEYVDIGGMKYMVSGRW